MIGIRIWYLIIFHSKHLLSNIGAVVVDTYCGAQSMRYD